MPKVNCQVFFISITLNAPGTQQALNDCWSDLYSLKIYVLVIEFSLYMQIFYHTQEDIWPKVIDSWKSPELTQILIYCFMFKICFLSTR